MRECEVGNRRNEEAFLRSDIAGYLVLCEGWNSHQVDSNAKETIFNDTLRMGH